jgi:hypothetical protein
MKGSYGDGSSCRRQGEAGDATEQDEDEEMEEDEVGQEGEEEDEEGGRDLPAGVDPGPMDFASAAVCLPTHLGAFCQISRGVCRRGSCE